LRNPPSPFPQLLTSPPAPTKDESPVRKNAFLLITDQPITGYNLSLSSSLTCDLLLVTHNNQLPLFP
jgi:hypothetical protein